MTDFLDAFLRDRVLALRESHLAGPVESDARLADGIYFSWGADKSQCMVTLSGEPGMILSFDATSHGKPGWFSLNFDLGTGSLEAGDTLVLIAEGAMTGAAGLPLFVRSNVDGALIDMPFSETLDLHATNGIVTLFHPVHAHSGVCGKPAFHTLVASLPPTPFHVSLRALRVLRIPASRGLPSEPQTLSSLAS
ncbi:MAG: hypothetical protein KDK01_11185 [Rhodobacteraceae bacterium]|jgi:hypothetical protein|nr:hypothetical protein [Paracoccaceae bacterium]